MQNNKAAQAALAGNNLIVVLIVLSLLAVGATVLVGKMLVTTIIQDTKVVNAKNKANATLETNLANAPRLIAAYEQLGNQQTIVKDALPNTADFPGIMVTLENIALQSRVQLTSIEPAVLRTVTTNVTGTTSAAADGTTSADGSATGEAAAAATKPVPKAYRVSTKFAGSFDSFVQVVKSLELSVRPMKLVSVKLSGTGSEMQVEADIETFYQDEAKLPFAEETIK